MSAALVALATLTLAVVLLCRPVPAIAADADTLASAPAGAGPSAAPVVDGIAVTPTLAAAVGSTPPSTLAFTTRRIANPRYRPPTPAVPWAGGATVSRLRALSFMRAQVTTFDATAATPTGLWELQAGEQYQDEDAVQGTIAGERTLRGSVVRELRFDARRSSIAATAGDVRSVGFERLVTLSGLRGLLIQRVATLDGDRYWQMLGGVPTPRAGMAGTRTRIAGLAVGGVPIDTARINVAAFAFDRPATAGGRFQPGLVAGRGGSVLLMSRAPMPFGTVSAGTEVQMHNLDGYRTAAGRQIVEWVRSSPTTSWSLHSERGSRRLHVIGLDRTDPAAIRDDRWSLQHLFGRGRGEWHGVGAWRDGGDSSLAMRNVQLGASVRPEESSMNAGIDVSWDQRPALRSSERRVSFSTGWVGANTSVVTSRLEVSSRSPSGRTVLLASESSFPLPGGARFMLEPRVSWQGMRLDMVRHMARITTPLAGGAARASLSLGWSVGRDDGFHGPRCDEASVALSLVPRPRDHADFEVTRRGGANGTGLEMAAAYELEAARYEPVGGGFLSSRDTSHMVVRVVRDGNGSGVHDVLISLDGKELRFTDADGYATFDRVAPGVHTVALEERSLGPNERVAQVSRVLVTVERGRRIEPIWFVIARPERRVKF